MKAPASNTLFKTGLIGTIITALCCFTPVLVILMGLIGLGAITGYLDYVLLPALAVFVGITIYAMARKQHGRCEEACAPGPPKPKI